MSVRIALKVRFLVQAAAFALVVLDIRCQEARWSARPVRLVPTRIRLALTFASLAWKARFLRQPLQLRIKHVKHVQRTVRQQTRVPASSTASVTGVTLNRTARHALPVPQEHIIIMQLKPQLALLVSRARIQRSLLKLHAGHVPRTQVQEGEVVQSNNVYAIEGILDRTAKRVYPVCLTDTRTFLDQQVASYALSGSKDQKVTWTATTAFWTLMSHC